MGIPRVLIELGKRCNSWNSVKQCCVDSVTVFFVLRDHCVNEPLSCSTFHTLLLYRSQRKTIMA